MATACAILVSAGLTLAVPIPSGEVEEISAAIAALKKARVR